MDVAGCAMPLQRIETVDEPASRAYVQEKLFDPVEAHQDDFRNRLIWGDNKLVMASLLKEFKGKIDLIYIDPPFDVGADFTMNSAYWRWEGNAWKRSIGIGDGCLSGYVGGGNGFLSSDDV